MRSTELEKLIMNVLIAGVRLSPFPSPLPSPLGRGRIVPLFFAQILSIVLDIYLLQGGAGGGGGRAEVEINSGRERKLGIASACNRLAEGKKARPDSARGRL